MASALVRGLSTRDERKGADELKHFLLWLGFSVVLPLLGFGLGIVFYFLLTTLAHNQVSVRAGAIEQILGVPDVLFVGVVAGATTLTNLMDTVLAFRRSAFGIFLLVVLLLALIWLAALYGGLVAFGVAFGDLSSGWGYPLFLWAHAIMIIVLSLLIQLYLLKTSTIG